MPARRPLEERFWEKVDKDGPLMPGMTTVCWSWTASKDGCGYGFIGLGNGKLGKADRVSWEMHFGVLAPLECALHHCDNPSCVRPDHLFKGTQKANADDRERKGRGRRAEGDRHWTRLSPERLKRGDEHWMRQQGGFKGERNGRAKVTVATVRAIRVDSLAGKTVKELALQHGLHTSSVRSIINKRNWSHVV